MDKYIEKYRDVINIWKKILRIWNILVSITVAKKRKKRKKRRKKKDFALFRKKAVILINGMVVAKKMCSNSGFECHWKVAGAGHYKQLITNRTYHYGRQVSSSITASSNVNSASVSPHHIWSESSQVHSLNFNWANLLDKTSQSDSFWR